MLQLVVTRHCLPSRRCDDGRGNYHAQHHSAAHHRVTLRAVPRREEMQQ